MSTSSRVVCLDVMAQLPVQSAGEVMESAGRLVDKHINADQRFYDLSGLLRIATHSKLE